MVGQMKARVLETDKGYVGVIEYFSFRERLWSERMKTPRTSKEDAKADAEAKIIEYEERRMELLHGTI